MSKEALNSTNQDLRILSLDASTKTGWAFFINDKLEASGLIKANVNHLELNKNADKVKGYPFSFVTESNRIVNEYKKLVEKYNPTYIVVENTVLSNNRHTQRLLEFIHYVLIVTFSSFQDRLVYYSPSEWRKILEMRLTKEDKEKNANVKAGLLKGKVTKKHLSVRFANTTFNLSLKVSTGNDIADAIGLGFAHYTVLKNTKTVDTVN